MAYELKQAAELSQRIELTGRERLTVTGVEDVERFDELSVAPPSVPAVKERIRGLETPQAELTARRAVEAATASEVHELIGVG